MGIDEKIEKYLNEKSLVGPSDVKRMVQLVKDMEKVSYKGKEYNVTSVSPTMKFIKTGTIDIDISKLKSYEIKNNIVILK